MSKLGNDESLSLKYSKKKLRLIEKEEETMIKRKKEYEDNLESKKELIRKEFEKKQKELMINLAGNSKSNEARLRKELDDLCSSNNKKVKELLILQNELSNMETITNLTASYHQLPIKKNNIDEYKMMIMTMPMNNSNILNSLSPEHFAMNEIVKPDFLYGRLKDLKDTLIIVEKQIENENQVTKGIDNKLNELTRDNDLMTKRVNELKRLNKHADSIFQNLEKIEFVAKNKYNTTRNDLTHRSLSLDNLKKKENIFLNFQKAKAENENNKLTMLQNQISETLINIDESKKKNEEYKQQLEELDIYHEVMRNKRVNAKLAYKYVDILNKLELEYFNKKEAVEDINQSKTRQSSPIDLSRNSSLNSSLQKIRNSSSHRRGSLNIPIITNRFLNLTTKKENRSRANSFIDNILEKSILQKNSFVPKSLLSEKNPITQKIFAFYENHPEGPNKLADIIIEKYQDLGFRNASMKNIYEDMADQKLKSEKIYSELLAEYNELKEQNEPNHHNHQSETYLEEEDLLYIPQSLDLAIFSLNNGSINNNNVIIPTLNQPGIFRENLNDLKNSLFTVESFIFRIYVDTFDLLIRFGKCIQAISEQSGGVIPLELEKLSFEILAMGSDFMAKDKKSKDKDIIKSSADYPNNRTETISSSAASETQIMNTEQKHNYIDLNEIIQAFKQVLLNCDKPYGTRIKDEKDIAKAAEEFANIIKQDIFIMTFLSVDEFKKYFIKYLLDIDDKEEAIKKIMDNYYELKNEALEMMMSVLKNIMKYYMEIMQKIIMNIKEFTEYFRNRNHMIKIDPEGILTKFEPSDYVKKVNFQKVQLMKEDNIRDRNKKRETTIVETINNNQDNSQNLEGSNLKIKICEIANNELKKCTGLNKQIKFNKTNRLKHTRNTSKMGTTIATQPANTNNYQVNTNINEEALSSFVSKNSLYSDQSQAATPRAFKGQPAQIQHPRSSFGSYSNPRRTFVERKQSLCNEDKLKSKSEFIENYIPSTRNCLSPTASTKNCYNVPHSKQTFFFGRNDYLYNNHIDMSKSIANNSTQNTPFKFSTFSKLKDTSKNNSIINEPNSAKKKSMHFKNKLSADALLSAKSRRILDKKNSIPHYGNQNQPNEFPKLITPLTLSIKKRSSLNLESLPTLPTPSTTTSRKTMKSFKLNLKDNLSSYRSLDSPGASPLLGSSNSPDFIIEYFYGLSARTEYKPILIQKNDY